MRSTRHLSEEKHRSCVGSDPVQNRDTMWVRLKVDGGRSLTCVETNRLDGCNWVKMCPAHRNQYEEWLLSHSCATRGRPKVRSEVEVRGAQSTMCVRDIAMHLVSGCMGEI